MKEHVLRLAKSARCNIFSHLVSFSYMGERLIPGLRRKDWILRALIVLSSKREIYLAKWKLMLTSDQAMRQRLRYKLFGGRRLHVSFSTVDLHPES